VALAIDGSTPAIAVQSNGSIATVTTASFTPPDGSTLLVMHSGNTIDPNNPGDPSVTDSLGSPLTYTMLDSGHRPDSPTAEGQVTTWVAQVASSAPMTVTVTTGALSPNRHAALCVLVITGADATPVGAHGKSSSLSAASIAQNFTGTASGSWGFIVVNDWAATGVETAGTGCTVIGSNNIGAPDISYGFFRRTTADGTNGGTTTMNVTIPSTSTSLRWAWVEIVPSTVVTDSPAEPPKKYPAHLLLRIAARQREQYGAEVAGAVIDGTASLTGAGALDATVTQGAPSTPTGAGALSSVVTQAAASTPTGAGALSAVVTQGSSSTPTGAGALSATGIVVVSGTASLTGAGALSSTVVQACRSTPTGAGALSATVTQRATSTPAGAGALSATVVQRATSTPTGAGALSSVVTQLATSTPTGAGVLTASGSQLGTDNGTATIAGAGALSATVTQRATSTPTGAGALSASGVVITFGTASLAGAGALSATVVQRATSILAGAGAVSATGSLSGVTVNGTATLVGRGRLRGRLTTPRPSTGVTVRPDTGTTARPGSGTTSRPGSGVTVRPYTGDTLY